MIQRETEQNYVQALALARDVVERYLSAHLQYAGGDRAESLEDLAQTVVGTESVVGLIMTVPFDERLYEPVLVEAADEVGRAFFPDVQKRFISSLEELPETVAAAPAAEDTEPARADLARAADGLPDDLKTYLWTLTDHVGAGYLTSRLWVEVSPDALAGRLMRLRRHYPDGQVPLARASAADEQLTNQQIVDIAQQVAAGIQIAFPWGFFARQTHERCAVATRYIVEREIRRAPEELLKEALLVFVAHGLGPALRRCGASVNRLLALAFPERIRPWMDSHVPPGYWYDAGHRQDAVRWLVERKLCLPQDGIADAVHEGKITKQDFSTAGLTWLIKNIYRWSVAEALREAYPALKPWELMRRTPTSLWDGEEGRRNATQAICWALGRAGLGREDMRAQSAAQLIRSALRPWHLTAAFSIAFHGKAALALSCVFPDTYEPWELAHLPREAWNDPSLRAKAVRWLLDRRGILPAEIPQALAQGRLTPETFKAAGLDGLLRVTGSVWRAISDALPDRFRRWQLGATPRSYWRSRSHVGEAVRWALERLVIPPDDVARAIREGRLTANDLVRLGLGPLILSVFRGDLTSLCQVADVLPSERFVPLSRYYRQTAWHDDGHLIPWRLGSNRLSSRDLRTTAAGTELDRRVLASRSAREGRRRRFRESQT